MADGHPTQKDDTDGTSDFNANRFMVMQILKGVRTAMPVRVLKCSNAGGLEAVGFVDVQPLVNQVDGDENGEPHAPLHNLPYFRVQGGANAVIIDPQPNDIGLAVFADRDTSTVKRTRAQANPGSRRQHDLSDGWFIGGMLNAAPEQYVRFHGDGIDVVSPKAINLRAPLVNIEASELMKITSPELMATVVKSTFTGTMLVQGLLTWMAGMVAGASASAGRVITGAMNIAGSLTVNDKRVDDQHTHSGVESGNDTSGPPT